MRATVPRIRHDHDGACLHDLGYDDDACRPTCKAAHEKRSGWLTNHDPAATGAHGITRYYV